MPWIILAITISYFIGSIPTAYIFGRVLKGIDIRKFGSGNVGATNALRVLGKGAGITVLTLDVFKGFVAVVFLGEIITSKLHYFFGETLLVILGISCISGHVWTIFMGFKGGKGIATTLGVLLGLAVKVSGLKAVLGSAILIWIAVFITTRIVSLSSVAAAVALPVLTVLFRQSGVLIFLSFSLCVLAIFRHKSNLKRILRGEEKKIF